MVMRERVEEGVREMGGEVVRWFLDLQFDALRLKTIQTFISFYPHFSVSLSSLALSSFAFSVSKILKFTLKNTLYFKSVFRIAVIFKLFITILNAAISFKCVLKIVIFSKFLKFTLKTWYIVDDIVHSVFNVALKC